MPEGRGTFGDLTVLENLRVGAIHRRDKDGIEQDIARMQTLFPKLSSRAKQAAGEARAAGRAGRAGTRDDGRPPRHVSTRAKDRQQTGARRGVELTTRFMYSSKPMMRPSMRMDVFS